jgi:hypothetical protein
MYICNEYTCLYQQNPPSNGFPSGNPVAAPIGSRNISSSPSPIPTVGPSATLSSQLSRQPSKQPTIAPSFNSQYIAVPLGICENFAVQVNFTSQMIIILE